MTLTWRDGLATVFVGAATALYLLWAAGTVSGMSAARTVSIAVFALGIAGCYTAKSQMANVYGVAGRPRPPLYYVVLVSALGAVTLVAGIVAVVTGGYAALATLTWATVALWALATIHHAMSRTTPEGIRTKR